LFEVSLVPAVRRAYEMATATLADLGAEVVKVDLPPATAFLAVFVGEWFPIQHGAKSGGIGIARPFGYRVGLQSAIRER